MPQAPYPAEYWYAYQEEWKPQQTNIFRDKYLLLLIYA